MRREPTLTSLAFRRCLTQSMRFKRKRHEVQCTLRFHHFFVADLKQNAQWRFLASLCFNQHLTTPAKA